MTLTVAGVAFLLVYAVWHLNLAARSVRETAGVLASRRARAVDAAPRAFWLVLLGAPGPMPVLTATVPAGLSLRLLVVADHDNAIEPPSGFDVHELRVPAGSDRTAILNAAYRYVDEYAERTGETAEHTVLGAVAAGAVPGAELVAAVSREFADSRVGAVQCRTRSAFRGPFGTAQQYEGAVLSNAAQILRSSRGQALLGVNGGFVRLSALRALGDEPWSAGAAEGLDLGRRLALAGAAVRYTSAGSVIVGALRVGGLVRQRARWSQGYLQAWPARTVHDRWAARLRWAAGFGGWLAPGVAVAAVLTLFVWAAGALIAGQPVGWAASWSALGQAAVVWATAVLTPSLIWWVARRREPSGLLWRGVALYPLLMLLRLAGFSIALVRQVARRRTWSPAARHAVRTPVTVATEPVEPELRPVFVDSSGRRRRRVRWLAYATAVLSAGYVMSFGVSLLTRPVVPLTAVPVRNGSLYGNALEVAHAEHVVLPMDGPTNKSPEPAVPNRPIAAIAQSGETENATPSPTTTSPTPTPTTPAPTTTSPTPAPTTPAPTTPAPTTPAPTTPAPTTPAPTTSGTTPEPTGADGDDETPTGDSSSDSTTPTATVTP